MPRAGFTCLSWLSYQLPLSWWQLHCSLGCNKGSGHGQTVWKFNFAEISWYGCVCHYLGTAKQLNMNLCMRYSTWILDYSPIEGLVPFSCKLTEPVWRILQRYLVTLFWNVSESSMLFHVVLKSSAQLHVIISQRSLQQGRGMLRLLLFWSSLGVNLKNSAICNALHAAQHDLCSVFLMLLKKIKAQHTHTVVNSSKISMPKAQHMQNQRFHWRIFFAKSVLLSVLRRWLTK